MRLCVREEFDDGTKFKVEYVCAASMSSLLHVLEAYVLQRQYVEA